MGNYRTLRIVEEKSIDLILRTERSHLQKRSTPSLEFVLFDTEIVELKKRVGSSRKLFYFQEEVARLEVSSCPLISLRLLYDPFSAYFDEIYVE